MNAIVSMLSLLSSAILYISNVQAVTGITNVEPWNLPVLPAVLPEIGEEFRNNTKGKLIPRHLWMAFKTVPEPKDRPDYLTQMFTKNVGQNWTLHLEDNDGKLAFMEKFYPNTSTLWAYKIIHPK